MKENMMGMGANTNSRCDFIKRNFMGANIIVLLRSGFVVSGEVVDGENGFIALKSGGTTIYVNCEAIDAFL